MQTILRNISLQIFLQSGFVYVFFSSGKLNKTIGTTEKVCRSHSKSLQLTTTKNIILIIYNNMKNIRSNEIVTNRGWEEGEGEGVLKLRNTKCLLYILLLITRCFYY